MKPLIVAITVAISLPLFAADEQKPQNTTPSTTLSAPVAQVQVDSPLVRAAKATGRLNKKPGFVITNDTLLRTGGGHIAWASEKTQQAPLPAAPAPAPATAPQTPPAQPQVKTKTDAAAKQKASSDYYGDSAEARHDDPAQQEQQMQQNAQPAKPPLN